MIKIKKEDYEKLKTCLEEVLSVTGLSKYYSPSEGRDVRAEEIKKFLENLY